jgi:hypothetical protein
MTIALNTGHAESKATSFISLWLSVCLRSKEITMILDNPPNPFLFSGPIVSTSTSFAA